MRCRSCSAEYPLSRYAALLDDDDEEKLANIPCDRL
ncbi:MAG: dual CXXC motif small (seleno)protein [Desulfovibrionales bacterium]